MQKRMELRAQDLVFILVLYRKKTLTEAAKFLGSKQSTLSRQLTELELRLDENLFSRHRQGLTPSLFVLNLIPHAEKLEVALRGANHATFINDNKPKGEVTISCPEAIADLMLAPFLCKFMDEFPNIRLKIISSAEIANLSQLDCDVAIRFGRKPDGDAVFTKLADSKIIVYGHPKFLLDGKIVNLDELPILHRLENQTPDSKILSEKFQNSLMMRSNRMTTCILAAQHGAGVVLLPEIFGKKLPLLTAIPVTNWDPPTISIYLASPRIVRKLKHVDATWTWIKNFF